MLRQISGAIVGLTGGISTREFANTVLIGMDRHLPNIEITHYYAGSGMASNHKKWSRRAIENLSNSDFDTFSILAFPNSEAASEGVEWTFRAEVSTTTSRGPQCVVLKLGFGESTVRNDLSGMLSFCDDMATRLKAESGHLHDLEDFADQNQKGIHFFKMAGKKVDSKKIKYSPVLGQRIIDVEQNPCHLHVYRSVDFCAAWSVYLGSDFLSMTGADPVEAERLGASVIRLDDQLWRITLFEDPFAFDSEENNRRLWAFRSVFRIDEVAHRFVTVY